ncbi:MAG TPA: HD domain-containing phosphohydrolase [bacterium]|nr:HD domain-containing phosphohydrolase [bacterium]
MTPGQLTRDAHRDARDARHLAGCFRTLNEIAGDAAIATHPRSFLAAVLLKMLRACRCEAGGIWVGEHVVSRGAPQAGTAVAALARRAGAAMHELRAVDDWRSVAGPAGQAMADVMAGLGLRATLTVPMWAGRRRVGGLVVASARPRLWSDVEVGFAKTAGRLIGTTVDRLRLLTETQQQAADLKVLRGLSAALRAAQTPEELYPLFAGYAARVLRADYAGVLLLEANHEAVTLVHRAGPGTLPIGSTLPIPCPTWREAVASGATLALAAPGSGNGSAWIDPSAGMWGPMSIVPLRAEKTTVGVLVLARSVERRPFTPRDVNLLNAIADIGGTAIRRTRLFQRLADADLDLVRALVRALDVRDHRTAGHSERVAVWAEAVARVLGCDPEEVRTIGWAALLHDIGKLGIPDAILKKTGPLTPEDRALFERHPIMGEAILSTSERMIPIRAIVRHHQEHWDGSGYPDGIHGEAIPLGARILSVVDAYAAMTEDRVYSSPRSHDDAIAELRRCAGTQFDPRVVECFCRVVPAQ